MKTLHTRCCIAGGGPAGIMLGYLLSRAGVPVVVLEKWPDFFRDFRGDTIHPSTMQVLHELGMLEDFLKLPHNNTDRVSGFIGGEEVSIADFTRLRARSPFIAFIPQWDFLNFLASKASAYTNFTLLMETEAVDLLDDAGRVVGVRAKNKEGEFDIRAELVVGADGRHSTVRQKSQLPLEDFGAPIDVLWFRLSRKDDGTKRSFGYANEGQVMVLLDRDEYWQCAYLIAKGDFVRLQTKGLEAFKKHIARLVPVLESALNELTHWEQVKLLSVAVDHLTLWHKDGLLCIGDSAHAMSPLGGVGINLAIQDAVAAANVLVPAFRRGTPTPQDCAQIQKRRAWPTRLTQRIQVLLHRRVLAPALKKQGRLRVPWQLRFLRVFPFLQWIPARLVGIGFRPEHVRINFSPPHS